MNRALVIGGGPAGLGAAARLTGWFDEVTVLEARGRDDRCRAGEHVPPSGLRKLASLGFADVLDERSHDDSPGVRSAWGAGPALDKDYFASMPRYGLNLRRKVFDEALARRAEQKGVTLRFRTRLEGIRREGTSYSVTARGPEGPLTLQARVVLDATGRRAAAALRLGARRRRHDELVGFAGRVEGCAPGPERGRIRLESMEDGWWYGVQFSDGTLLATFMTDPALAQRHPGRARGLWSERLQQSRLLAPLARAGRWEGRLRSFDAAVQVLDHDAPEGFLAVGDAAAAYDPLSSWGITKGLCDGHAGAEALAREAAGDRGAVAEHRDEQRRGFAEHRARRLDFYRAEARWPRSPFWRSRRAAESP